MTGTLNKKIGKEFCGKIMPFKQDGEDQALVLGK
jgi:hypothetical protein